ncbi:MAG: zinc-binding alcohol dehydrogenase [Proteobacteria bacterium]|nr:zinc-binding alcohol dehydrogenase [Pseudomonadota bacterium]
MSETARALFYTAPMQAELRPVRLAALEPQDALVRMEFSALSRGTERLVASGGVPIEEADRLRCPLQEGDFPFPVKYGYCAVGVVEAGPEVWVGRRVFVLHPHQDRFICGINWLNDVPDHVPAARATLAANMETALNAVWDSGVSAADRVVVVGGGLVGLLVSYLCAQMPGTQVTLVDTNPARAALAHAFGAGFAPPEATLCGADVVFHTSASAAGLATALSAARDEGTVVEMSWYGAKEVAVPLGGAFHAGRIKLISSQVGRVSPGHAARGWTYGDRLQAALRLLGDERLDLLLSEPISFEDLPGAVAQLLAPDATGVVSLVKYGV